MTEKQTGARKAGNEAAAKGLRKRAEEKVRSNEHLDLGELPPGEVRVMREMLHELRVAQAELEMQNEELRQTQVALETARAKHFDFYNLASVGYFTLSGKDLILEANLTSAHLLGTEISLLADQPFTRLIAAEDQDSYYLFRKKLFETGSSQKCELRMAGFDGALFWAYLRGAVAAETENGDSVCYIVMSDITERKAADEKLKAAKAEAEAATMLKDKFVSLVAHDLKSPIGHNILALKSLRARLKDGGSPFADDPILTLAVSSNENMLQTIRDLLDKSRIRSGVISPCLAFTDARHLVQYAIDMEAGAAKHKQITVLNGVPPRTRLYCDMKLTGEILVNLILNAIKFSAKGSTVTIGPKEGEPSTFFIKDAGVGIAPDRLATLFKYEEAKSTSGTEGERGTGFGLPLSNELMKGQGGSLRVEPAPGKGTTVTISFPHVVPKALVVEDSMMDVELARLLLKGIGIEVIGAADGEEGLRLMEKELPHLILLDINLPGIDGLEVLRRKRDNPKIAAIPAIITTVNVDPDVTEEALRLGAADFIKKPLQAGYLAVRIRKFVS